MRSSVTFGSLFAGIGGFDLGFERAGLKCQWQVEIDPYCQRVLAKHWPDVRRHDDVRTFPNGDPKDWQVDVICGGFPCQDISYAGNGESIREGTRSGLWSEYCRIIRVVRPKFVVVENVAALLTRGLGRVLGDLAELGFDAEWDVLSSCQFGAAHTRERVFILADCSKDGRKNETCNVQSRTVPQDRFHKRSGWWLPEPSRHGGSSIQRVRSRNDSKPSFCGTVDEFPDWMDRVGSLGNSVDPVVAEWIGRRLMESTE